jgi:uncharacterized membrane protein
MTPENNLQILQTPQASSAWLDRTGMAASWLCALHCLALPFTVSILPLIGLSFLLSENTERVFIGISILIASVSLVPSYFRQHGRIRALALFTSGISLILTSHLLLEESFVFKAIFLLAGGALITTAHFINRRLCLECDACQTNAG